MGTEIWGGAGSTHASQQHVVIGHGDTEALGNRINCGLELVVIKCRDISALRAHHVVVMVSIGQSRLE
jgi:hypothetical protein